MTNATLQKLIDWHAPLLPQPSHKGKTQLKKEHSKSGKLPWYHKKIRKCWQILQRGCQACFSFAGTTCVFSFSPFCTRSSNSNTFVASFLKPITFCGQLALSVFIVCTSQCLDLLSKYFNWRSVGLWWIQAFLLIGVTARIMSFWQTALLTLERCEENCVTGADEPRKRAFISQFFPRQPFVGASEMRCSDKISQFERV